MSGTNDVARNLLVQEPGRELCHANAANTQIVAQPKEERHNGGNAYAAKTTDDDTSLIVLFGRVRWALDKLRKAVAAGCMPINKPAPMWRSYIFDLAAQSARRCCMNSLDTLHLRCLHSFTKAQAHSLAALKWEGEALNRLRRAHTREDVAEIAALPELFARRRT